MPTVQKLVAAGKGKALLTETVLSAFFYYLYNEGENIAKSNSSSEHYFYL